MYVYKLTRRGKIVLIMLVIILISTGLLTSRTIAMTRDSYEVTINNTLYKSNKNENSEYISYSNEIKKISEVALKEYLINNEIKEINKEDFLSISVEDISEYNKKIAFLTFDDGPSQNVTPLILKILENYNIKATFFVLGSLCEKNSSILKDIKDDGHSIGIHSYSHNSDELLKSKDSLFNEIKMTEDVIKQNIGLDFTTRLFRFPGGSFENNKTKYINDLNEAGYVSVDWNALTGDSEYSNPKPEILLEKLKLTTMNKDKIIVLMHDSSAKEVTAEILPEVIEYLKSNGYEFAILK